MSMPAAIKAGSSVPLGEARPARQIEENQVSCQHAPTDWAELAIRSDC